MAGPMPEAPLTVRIGELVPVDDPGTVFEHGGNATLFRCRYRDHDFLFKKFRTEHLADVDEAALLELVAWRSTLAAATRDRLDGSAAWPRHVVRDGDRLRGLLVPVAADRFFRARPTGVRTPRSFYDLLASRHRVAAPLAEKLTAAAHAVRTVLWLHGLGVVVDDLQPDNLLCATDGAGVYLVDCDSMVGPRAWGRVAEPTAPDLMTAVVAGRTPADPASDLTKLTWILLRTLVNEPGLTHVGDRERVKLAGIVSADTAAFLLGALDRVPEPAVWSRFADRWQELARSAGTDGVAAGRARVHLAGRATVDEPRPRPAARWNPDLAYEPPPAPPLFPHRYTVAAPRSRRLVRTSLLAGVALVLAALAALLTVHTIAIEGSLWP
jgi:hypothetical protein